MACPIDLRTVVPANRMRGETKRETGELKGMLKEARAFLVSFRWCRAIREQYFGLGIGGVVAVFLFRIAPTAKEVDEWLCVVVGDLPPAYLVLDISPDPVSALRSYIREMNKWVVAAKKGKPTEHLIPVNVPATPAWAKRLERRLVFLRSELIPHFAAK